MRIVQEKLYSTACVTSNVSEQPAHLHRLITTFASALWKAKFPSLEQTENEDSNQTVLNLPRGTCHRVCFLPLRLINLYTHTHSKHNVVITSFRRRRDVINTHRFDVESSPSRHTSLWQRRIDVDVTLFKRHVLAGHEHIVVTMSFRRVRDVTRSRCGHVDTTIVSMLCVYWATYFLMVRYEFLQLC